GGIRRAGARVGHVAIQRRRGGGLGFLLGGKRAAKQQQDQNQNLHRLPFVATTRPFDSTRAGKRRWETGFSIETISPMAPEPSATHSSSSRAPPRTASTRTVSPRSTTLAGSNHSARKAVPLATERRKTLPATSSTALTRPAAGTSSRVSTPNCALSRATKGL